MALTARERAYPHLQDEQADECHQRDGPALCRGVECAETDGAEAYQEVAKTLGHHRDMAGVGGVG